MSSKTDQSKDKSSAERKKKSAKAEKSDKSRDSSKEKKAATTKKREGTKSPPKSNRSDDDKSLRSKKSKNSTGEDRKPPTGQEILNPIQGLAFDSAKQDEHQNSLLQQAKEPMKCVHHEIQLQFFCESCEEPICRQCTILGPHNNQLHRINRVDEAYKSRVSRLSEGIRSNLLQKRDQLLAQIHRLEYRIEEIRYVKTIIERDARAEYGGIIERLKSAEGIKVAVLQHEMSELQKDLDRINDLGHTFNEFTRDPNDPIGFLLRARNLYENIEFLVSKPFKINIDVYPYDLPRELTEMRLQLQKVNAQKALIDFKNEVIWRMIEEKKQAEDKIRTNMEDAVYQEMQEWAKITEKYSNELKRYYLVCFYCNTQLEESTINKKCPNNTQGLDPQFRGYTQKIPDSKYHGNHRHYFARAAADFVDHIYDPSQRERATAQVKNNYFVQIEVQFAKIRKTIEQQKINLQNIFQKHDKNKTGIINDIQMLYILTEKLDLEQADAEKILKFFDPNGKKSFMYSNFLDMLNDPNLIDKYPEKQRTAFQQEQNIPDVAHDVAEK